MIQKKQIFTLCMVAVLASATVFQTGLEAFATSPATTAAKESTEIAIPDDVKGPFDFDGRQLSSASVQNNGISFVITDERDLNAILTELKALGVDSSKWSNTRYYERSPNGLTLTLEMEGNTYTYIPGMNGSLVQAISVYDSGVYKLYTTTRKTSVLRGILEGIMTSQGYVSALALPNNQPYEISLYNSQNRTYTNLGRQTEAENAKEIMLLLANSRVIPNSKESAVMLGERQTGVDEIRANHGTNRYVYSLYSGGIRVKNLSSAESGAVAEEGYYRCSPESLAPLFKEANDLFSKSNIGASWLGMMSPSHYKSVKATASKDKSLKTVADNALFQNFKDLHVYGDSIVEVKSHPKTWDYHYELLFSTNVSYSIYVSGNHLTISSSDIKGTVLRYTMKEDANFTNLSTATDKALGIIRKQVK